MHVADKFRTKPDYFLAFRELITAAQCRGLITYYELADAVWGNHGLANVPGNVSHILGEISEDEFKKYKRPMLSAVCVSDPNGFPGHNFFGLAEELTGQKLNIPPNPNYGKPLSSEERAFWEKTRQDLYDTWRRPQTLLPH